MNAPQVHLVGPEYGAGRTACGRRVVAGLVRTVAYRDVTCPDCERVDTEHLPDVDADSLRAHYARQAARRRLTARLLAAWSGAVLVGMGGLALLAIYRGDWPQATFWGLALAWCHAHPLVPSQEG